MESETPGGKGTGVLTLENLLGGAGESKMAHCFKVPIELTLGLIPFEMYLSQERSDEEMHPPTQTM